MATLVILITVVFFTKTLLSYYQQIQYSIFSLSPIKIIASFCLFLGYLYMRALSWRLIIYFLGGSIGKPNSFPVWFFSEATRYIPGNVWSFASRVHLARQNRLSQNVSLLMVPVEILIVTATTAILSSYAIIKNLEILPGKLTFLIIAITSIATISVMFLLHKKIRNILNKLFTRELNLKALFIALLLQFVSWSLYSAGTIVLISNLADVDLLPLFSSTLLAWLIGYLSIITPMGLGIREGAFVLLTGQQIGIAQALLIAVLARVILLIAELTNLAFWVGINKFAFRNVNKIRGIST